MKKYNYRYCVIMAENAGQMAYGIAIEQWQGTQWAVVRRIENIASKEDIPARLAASCTRLQLDPIHILDVILDTIP